MSSEQFEISKIIEQSGIIAVTEIDDISAAVPLASALFEGGIKIMEIAFRNQDALDTCKTAICKIRKEVPQICVGGATIINSELAQKAVNAGAQFILSAGFNPSTVEYCIKNNIPVFPGVCTPGEIEQALDFGLDVLKLFPAGIIGGTGMLKALAGPYNRVKFIVSGGLNESNASEYLLCKNTAAISGSWISPKKLIAEKDFASIKKNAEKTVSIFNQIRKN